MVHRVIHVGEQEHQFNVVMWKKLNQHILVHHQSFFTIAVSLIQTSMDLRNLSHSKIPLLHLCLMLILRSPQSTKLLYHILQVQRLYVLPQLQLPNVASTVPLVVQLPNHFSDHLSIHPNIYEISPATHNSTSYTVHLEVELKHQLNPMQLLPRWNLQFKLPPTSTKSQITSPITHYSHCVAHHIYSESILPAKPKALPKGRLPYNRAISPQISQYFTSQQSIDLYTERVAPVLAAVSKSKAILKIDVASSKSAVIKKLVTFMIIKDGGLEQAGKALSDTEGILGM